MSTWSRRRVLRLGGLSALAGVSGCTAVPFTGTLGFRLRNYTSEAYDARIEIRFHGQTAFERTYRLPIASGGDPYVHVEADAVSNVPKGATYNTSVFLDGVEERTIEASMDCTDREDQQMDEEISIDIGFGGGDAVEMAETGC
jgi:hypothetical protein